MPAASSTGPPASGGPPPLVPALAFAVLTIAATVTGAAAPRPGTAAADVLGYDSTHIGVLTLLGTLLFASSVPLVIWAATTYRQLSLLGVAAPAR